MTKKQRASKDALCFLCFAQTVLCKTQTMWANAQRCCTSCNFMLQYIQGYDEMIRIAKNNLATVNESIDSLPAAQVTVLLSNNNIFQNTWRLVYA